MLETVEEFNNTISKCKTEDNIASKITLAVMTVCGSLGSKINIPLFYNYYKEGVKGFTLSYIPNSKKLKDEKNKAFYNCLKVNFLHIDRNNIESKISAKIFPNGSIQIPGCRTIDSVYETSQIIYDFVKKTYNECKEKNINIIADPDNFKLSNVRIVMINSNFSFNKCIFQERLKNLLNNERYDGIDENKSWRMATFAPEKYSGVNIRFFTTAVKPTIKEKIKNGEKIQLKLDGQVSIFIFKSGKSTITGAKNTKNLYEAYVAITNFVRDNQNVVLYN